MAETQPPPGRLAGVRPGVAAAGCVTAAVVLMAVVLGGVFHGFARSGDEYAYRYQARTFLAGRLVNPPAPDPEIFHQVHIISTPDKTVSKYPPGWPAILAAGEATGLAFVVNPMLTGLLLWVVFLLARRLEGSTVALVLVALLATNPFLLMNGATYFSGPLATLLWVLALFAVEAYLRRPGHGAALLFGACHGVLLLARPQNLLFLVPGTALIAVLVLRRAGARRGLGDLALGAVPLLGAGILFMAYNTATTGDPFLTGHMVANPTDRPTLDLLAAVRITGTRGIQYLEFSWILPVLLLGPGILHGPRRGLRRTALFLAGTFMAAYGLYAAPGGPPQFGPRYWLPAHPLLVFLVAVILVRVIRPRALAPAVALLALLQLAQTGAVIHSAALTTRTAAGVDRAGRVLAAALDTSRAWVAVAGSVGAAPSRDLVRNDLDYRNRVQFIRTDRPWTSFGDRLLYVWEGGGGPPALRSLSPRASVHTVYATHPPRVLDGPERQGWTTTTASNRCAKYRYAFPGARGGDWARFVTCGTVSFSDASPPGPGEAWEDGSRHWFVRHYRSSLQVDRTDTYCFSLLADDVARLFVDGREVLRAASGDTDLPAEVRLRLEPGFHPITIAYSNIGGPARLTWSTRRVSDGTEVEPDRYRTWVGSSRRPGRRNSTGSASSITTPPVVKAVRIP